MAHGDLRQLLPATASLPSGSDWGLKAWFWTGIHTGPQKGRYRRESTVTMGRKRLGTRGDPPLRVEADFLSWMGIKLEGFLRPVHPGFITKIFLTLLPLTSTAPAAAPAFPSSCGEEEGDKGTHQQ